MSNSILRDNDLDLAVADGADTENASDPVPQVNPMGETCSNCGAPLPKGLMNFCKQCGYYPSLGMCFEVDPWDHEDLAAARNTEEPLSLVRFWMNLIPKWAWKLIGYHLAIVMVSVAIVWITTYGSTFRMIWSVSQLLLGFAAFSACHLLAYLSAIGENADFTLLDLFLKPFKIWIPVIRQLPDSLMHVALGTCGLNAMLMSVFVIGALPYSILWDWGIEEPPKRNLVSAIVAHAQEAEGDEDELEDAIGNFTGTAADQTDQSQQLLERQRQFLDCLIVGYTMDDAGETIRSLVLAREFKGKLMIVANVQVDSENETWQKYHTRFQSISRIKPFVNTSITAHWIEPVYTCRVSYLQENLEGKLAHVRFEKMLGLLDGIR